TRRTCKSPATPLPRSANSLRALTSTQTSTCSRNTRDMEYPGRRRAGPDRFQALFSRPKTEEPRMEREGRKQRPIEGVSMAYPFDDARIQGGVIVERRDMLTAMGAAAAGGLAAGHRLWPTEPQ